MEQSLLFPWRPSRRGNRSAEDTVSHLSYLHLLSIRQLPDWNGRRSPSPKNYQIGSPGVPQPQKLRWPEGQAFTHAVKTVRRMASPLCPEHRRRAKA